VVFIFSSMIILSESFLYVKESRPFSWRLCSSMLLGVTTRTVMWVIEAPNSTRYRTVGTGTDIPYDDKFCRDCRRNISLTFKNQRLPNRNCSIAMIFTAVGIAVTADFYTRIILKAGISCG
jgi:hypothetical protein